MNRPPIQHAAIAILVLSWGLTPQALAGTHLHRKAAPIIEEEEPEPVATEAQLKPVLKKASEACLKQREIFVKKYTAVGEIPADTCSCVMKSIVGQKSLALAKETDQYYRVGAKDIFGPSREYISMSEENCRVDHKWETGTLRPDNYDKRMSEIEELMKVRHKSTSGSKTDK